MNFITHNFSSLHVQFCFIMQAMSKDWTLDNKVNMYCICANALYWFNCSYYGIVDRFLCTCNSFEFMKRSEMLHWLRLIWSNWPDIHLREHSYFMEQRLKTILYVPVLLQFTVWSSHYTHALIRLLKLIWVNHRRG